MKGISGNEIIKNKITRTFGKPWHAAGVALFVIVFLAGCTASPAVKKRISGISASYSKASYDKKKYKLGIRQGNKAVTNDPTNGRAWYWLGTNYKEDGQYDKAIRAYKKVVELNQEIVQVKSSYYNLGYVYHIKTNYSEAIRYFSKRLEMDPGDWTYGKSYFFRRDNYLYAGMYDEALQDASSAVKYLHATSEINLIFGMYITSAFAHLGLGETDMALAMIDKAKEIYPGWSPDHHLALIYYATGDEQKPKELLGDKGWLGIVYGKAVEGPGKVLQLKLYINVVVKGSSAEKGGLLENDLIVRMNDSPVLDYNGFNRRMRGLASGSTIRLEILRGKEKKELNIRLGSRSDKYALAYILGRDRLIAPLLAKRKMFAPAVEAEKNGQYRKAFRLYRQAPRPDSEIIGRIISLYHKLDPAPAITEKARKQAVFAATATKVAKDNSGYDQAINEYYKVVRIAPWWADPYINLALLLEKRGRFAEANKALRYYLKASPDAPDASAIQTKLYELEFKAKNIKP